MTHKFPPVLLALILCLLLNSNSRAQDGNQVQPDREDASEGITAAELKLQQQFLSDLRQLTFAGKRSGEGYFSADGRKLVFQSEREPENPFFQIYVMDRETGDQQRVSPGVGRTTCAWIHPDGQRVMFASTQFDPNALDKQREEIEFRQSDEAGKRRYNWAYDETYDIVECDLETGEYRKLTTEAGYDAEGSYSPDGKLICFASNRRAYAGELTAEEAELFEKDLSSAMDLYVMNADGTNVRRLTDAIGYDGGPFFSPDGSKICWRRFEKNGAIAEIMVMNVDGTDQRAITRMETMAWAPFFHPSGDYLIFNSNKYGFENFELFIVDANGKSDPVRVTYREGFDAMASFSPDGASLVWTSNAGGSQSQLYEASWNDAAARELLGLDNTAEGNELAEAEASAKETVTDFSPQDILRHVDYLCRPELGGRLTGTPGELKATAYVAAYLGSLGMVPVGRDGFFHEFEFISSVTLGEGNALRSGDKEFVAGKQWSPVFFSKDGPVEPTEIVCAGYGIVAPEEEGQEEYDSYVHLDVKDKWVLVFRQMPQDITPERRQQLARYSGARYKAMVARDRGARGLIFVSGPNSPIRNRVMPLTMDGTLGTSSLTVVSVADEVAESWLEGSGKSLKDLQSRYDSGEPAMGWALPATKLAANIDVEPVTSKGRNVLALLPAGDEPSEEMVVIGAHIDHLGTGQSGSLAKEEELGGVHRGADDNASGVATMLEVAQYLAYEVEEGRLKPKRDILFAAWSGEELGLRGSKAFANEFYDMYPPRMAALLRLNLKVDHASAPKTPEERAAANSNPHAGLGNMPLYPAIAACLNMDMVGRLRGDLVLQGIGSSPDWTGVIERRNAVVRLPLKLQNDCNLPTDASSFFVRGVPILSAFTGSHSEYHTPRDTPELLNYEGAATVAKLMALVARDLVQAEKAPTFTDQPAEPERRASLAAYLGTVPDYAQEVKGVMLSSVTNGAPADKAGLKGGDIVIELAGKKIENIYDYTYAIEALKIDQPTKVKVKRGDEEIELEIIPGSRS